MRTKKADVVVGFYTRQKGVVRQHDDLGYRNALLQPMQAAFAVRKECEDLRQALDGALKAMWSDGSLNRIKQVYLDPPPGRTAGVSM
ncbi:MAG: transporter substrate-binding domain-containing protein [Deltaproteobacteria bacterium]|nr:MAG: transporter substrate-binding domain-containing protein [Deltaproteobacteria bacterium]TMB13619.1 MAG: transporter substrate-binding domain-containing protein [Deltaproteobacteria bacterium]